MKELTMNWWFYGRLFDFFQKDFGGKAGGGGENCDYIPELGL
jgi:hypothetical protein